MSGDEWGFGSGSGGKGFVPFEDVTVAGAECELSFGEHPHTRRDDNIYVRRKGNTGEPQGFNGHRHPWRVEVQEENYWKESELSGDECRGSCTGRLYMGETLVGVTRARKAEDCLLRILSLMPIAGEHPVAIWDPKQRESIKGRKVYYRNEPGVIRYLDGECLEVVIDAATESGSFARAPWQESRDEDRTSLRVDFYSNDVWWWRDAD